ncbi:pro-sigmaK processing inhibitor BofA family protein [Candidatus Stoquefichus sp. SB1]|uniref:pro-sigmaK processing inhibitor BofA family protein n=1 Tax=Candidatus Stoquefichus sp. SB1 TaxID=1658109 RepID=UPI0009E636B2|nr:pro-sigmaK processing inhibitor BofA family protein [Candidatus Stoquefichus sp. SB1]
MNEVIFLVRRITRIFFRLLFATLFIFVFNSLQSLTHMTLTLNVFNILMISLFDVFGVALCIILKCIL